MTDLGRILVDVGAVFAVLWCCAILGVIARTVDAIEQELKRRR